MRLFAMLALLFVGTLTINLGSAGHAHAAVKSRPHKHKRSSKRVVVKTGDTLSKIAKKNSTTYVRIFYANKKIKDPNVIFAGQKLRIPAKNEHLKPRPLHHAAVVRHHTAPPRYTSRTYSAPVYSYSVSGGIWDRIAQCESGGNWSINTGNGYYGGLQFTLSSWRAVGGSGLPSQASKSEQIARAQILQSRQGWGAWPACTAKLGIS